MNSTYSRSLLVAGAWVLAACSAFGGAWGTGAFDNDDAQDWVWELEASSTTSVIEDALGDVTGAFFYISAAEGARAIAAAEIVAALDGKPHPELPDEVKYWVEESGATASEQLIELATKAVTLVRDSRKSELSDLWLDSGGSYREWHAAVTDLLNRLA